MKTLTGKCIKKKYFSNKIIIEEKDGTQHQLKTNKYIMETLSYAFYKDKVASFAIDDKGKAFFMLPQSSGFFIKSDLEKSLRSQKNKELISCGIPSVALAMLGSLLVFCGVIASIVAYPQTGIFALNTILACSIMSLPAFYMSKKIMDKFFNIRKILKHDHLLSKMTNHLNNYNTITLNEPVDIKEKEIIKQ